MSILPQLERHLDEAARRRLAGQSARLESARQASARPDNGRRRLPAWPKLRLIRVPVLLVAGLFATTAIALAASGVMRPRTASHATGLASSYVIDLTWVSDEEGWALLGTPCGKSLCPRIAHTDNGGRSWRALPSPPAQLTEDAEQAGRGCGTQACIGELRFATPSIGYLFGPSLLMTRDGGRTWTRVPSRPVESLEPGPGAVVRLVYNHTGCPGPCKRTLEAAAPGSTDWRLLLPSMPVLKDSGSAAAHAEVIRADETIYVPIYGAPALGAGAQEATIYRSEDDARTWTTLPDPCAGGDTSPRNLSEGQLAIAFAADPGGFLAALCSSRIEGKSYSVITSEDYGETWGLEHPLPAGFSPQLLAAASPTNLLVSNGPFSGKGRTAYSLLLSSDGGEQWSTVASEHRDLSPRVPAASFLGFEDSQVGRWVGFPRAIWTTTDGGSRWIRRPFR